MFIRIELEKEQNGHIMASFVKEIFDDSVYKDLVSQLMGIKAETSEWDLKKYAFEVLRQAGACDKNNTRDADYIAQQIIDNPKLASAAQTYYRASGRALEGRIKQAIFQLFRKSSDVSSVPKKEGKLEYMEYHLINGKEGVQ